MSCANSDFEQMKLILNCKGELTKLENLRRCRTPLISKVQVDEFTNEANKNFDFEFDGINKFYPFEFPEVLKDLDFNILCIVGSSGAGKSVFSKYFGEEKKVEWDNSKAIISNFDNVDDAIERLNSVGLNSIPTWCKPRNVLSIGEGFRVDLARQIEDNCVIDEFTSTVDRNVAISCSNSIQKYIRKKNIKRCVFVSCHKDFIDTLLPDYVIDLDDCCIYDTRGLPKRKFNIQIYETNAKKEVWEIFKRHHYLSADLNICSKCFVAFMNDEPIGFISILPLPSGTISNAWRVHRLVILPDYQGLGIASKLITYIANLYVKAGANFYIRTTHVKLRNYFMNNSNWKETQRSGSVCPNQGGALKNWKIIEDRIAYSFKYVGDYNKDLDSNDIDVVKYIDNVVSQEVIEQACIFDFIDG